MNTARQAATSCRGFSLLEALFATTILAIGVGALSELALLSARAGRDSRLATLASLFAHDKMNELGSDAWSGGGGLSPAPPETLDTCTEGYCDYLDSSGRVLGAGSLPMPGTVFVRRWSVEPLPANPVNTLVLQVVVSTGSSADATWADEAHRSLVAAYLMGLRTRKAGG